MGGEDTGSCGRVCVMGALDALWLPSSISSDNCFASQVSDRIACQLSVSITEHEVEADARTRYWSSLLQARDGVPPCACEFTSFTFFHSMVSTTRIPCGGIKLKALVSIQQCQMNGYMVHNYSKCSPDLDGFRQKQDNVHRRSIVSTKRELEC